MGPGGDHDPDWIDTATTQADPDTDGPGDDEDDESDGYKEAAVFAALDPPGFRHWYSDH